MTALMALLITVPVLAVIAQPASAHERTTQRCDYDPISGMSFNCRQVPVSHTHPKPKPEPTCPSGTTGTPPNCVPIPSDNTNHAGDQGDDSDGSESSDGNGDSDGPFGGSQEENPTQENINSQNNQNHDSDSNQRDESSDDTEPEDSNGGTESGEQGDAEEGSSDGTQLSNPPVRSPDSGDEDEGGSDPESDQDTGSGRRPGPCQTQPPRPGCTQNPDTGNTSQGPAQDNHQDPDLDDVEEATALVGCQWLGQTDRRVGLVCGGVTILTELTLDTVEGEDLDVYDIGEAAIGLAGCAVLTPAGGVPSLICAGTVFVVPHIEDAVVNAYDAIVSYSNSGSSRGNLLPPENFEQDDDPDASGPPTGTTTPSDPEPDDADESNGDEGSQVGSGESTPSSESPPTGTTTPSDSDPGSADESDGDEGSRDVSDTKNLDNAAERQSDHTPEPESTPDTAPEPEAQEDSESDDGTVTEEDWRRARDEARAGLRPREDMIRLFNMWLCQTRGWATACEIARQYGGN